MGDISFAQNEEFQRIIDRTSKFPETRFLFCTKNPARYLSLEFPDNCVLGATIESDVIYSGTKAPSPMSRYKAMVQLKHLHKFISIEPVMKFDLSTMVYWMSRIGPEIVEIGGDNYGHGLPESEPWQVWALIKQLGKFVPRIIQKPGLDRILGKVERCGLCGEVMIKIIGSMVCDNKTCQRYRQPVPKSRR